jgi:hypothetical protein
LQAQGKAQKALPAAETEIDAAIGQDPVPAGTRG